MTDLSDQLLLREFRAGDIGAFDALFRRYAARVHATAYRLTHNWEDAEDALQEVFIRLSGRAGSIRGGASLASWIYRTTVNCSHDRLRKRRNTVSIESDEQAGGRVLAVESLRRDAERQESRRRDALLSRIEALIPRLPERQAAVFVLRYFQGLSHRDIAAALGCSEGSSKSLHSLACRKLRQWVQAAESARQGDGPVEEAKR